MSQSLKLSCKGKCEYLELSSEKKCCSKLEIERDDDDLWVGIHDYKGNLLGDLFLDTSKQKELLKFLQIPHRDKNKEKTNAETICSKPADKSASEKGNKNEIDNRSNIGVAA